MSGFNMNDYVDVAERIREFAAKYPKGSLQSELTQSDKGWLCKAYAYRTPDDERPGIGHAFEPVPGKTPYTRDSEAMNAETSAWGRAIVALGFNTKKIASANEVRNRQDDPAKAPPAVNAKQAPQRGDSFEAKRAVTEPPAGDKATPKQIAFMKRLVKELADMGAPAQALEEELVKRGGYENVSKAGAKEFIDKALKLKENLAKRDAQTDTVPF